MPIGAAFLSLGLLRNSHGHGDARSVHSHGASAENRARPFGHVSERATQRLEAENALVLVRRTSRHRPKGEASSSREALGKTIFFHFFLSRRRPNPDLKLYGACGGVDGVSVQAAQFDPRGKGGR